MSLMMETQSWRDVERLVRNRQVDIGFSDIGHLREAPSAITPRVRVTRADTVQLGIRR